jgi:hypothetical protein
LIDPSGGETGEVLGEPAGDDAAVRLVGVERCRVTASQLQRRGCLPRMGEAVEAFELFDAAIGAQLGEQPATTDTLELSGGVDPVRRTA